MNKSARQRRMARPGVGATPGALIAATGMRPASAQGGSKNERLGKRVITKSGAVLKVGNTIVDNEKPESGFAGGLRTDRRVYRVEHVNGPWLWLQDEKAARPGG